MTTVAALLIHHPEDPERLLAVQRPDDPQEEFPGLWGLPAATCRPGESLHEAAHRAAREKLGLALQSLAPVAFGAHQRSQGVLAMTLFEATTHAQAPVLPTPRPDGSTYYTAWRWASPAILEEGVAQGSLCCALALGLGREERARERLSD